MKPWINSFRTLSITAVLLLLTACQENILHDLSEHEVNRLIAKLHEVNISAKKIKQPEGRWAIAVKNSEAIRSIQILDDSRLLRGLNKTEKEKPALISSREEQRARIERTLAEQIQTTLTSIPGVLEAHVHLNLPPVDPLFGQPLTSIQGSASVLLITSTNYIMKSQDIALLVSGAAGLPAEKISILVSSNNEQENSVSLESTVIKEQQPSDNANSDERAHQYSWWQNNELMGGIVFLLFGIAGLAAMARLRKPSRATIETNLFNSEANKDDFMRVIRDKSQ